MGPWPRITTTSRACGFELHHAFQAGIHRFDEAGAIEGDAVGDFFHAATDDPVHHADILRKSAAGRFVARRYADLFVHGALSVELVAAIEAFEARDVVKGDDAVAGEEIANTRPGGDHHAGGFVAVDTGRRKQIIFDFFEIGVTDPAAFDADQELARADLRRRDLLHRDGALASVDGSAHGRRSG